MGRREASISSSILLIEKLTSKNLTRRRLLVSMNWDPGNFAKTIVCWYIGTLVFPISNLFPTCKVAVGKLRLSSPVPFADPPSFSTRLQQKFRQFMVPNHCWHASPATWPGGWATTGRATAHGHNRSTAWGCLGLGLSENDSIWFWSLVALLICVLFPPWAIIELSLWCRYLPTCPCLMLMSLTLKAKQPGCWLSHPSEKWWSSSVGLIVPNIFFSWAYYS